MSRLSHEQLVEKALQQPGVKAAYDAMEEESKWLEEQLIANKENYLFYYRLPIDGLQQIMTFGWIAIRNGYQYSNDFDIHLIEFKEAIVRPLKYVLLQLKSSMEERLGNLDQEIDKSTFTRETLDGLVKDRKEHYGDSIYFAKSPQEFLIKLTYSEHAPDVIRKTAIELLAPGVFIEVPKELLDE